MTSPTERRRWYALAVLCFVQFTLVIDDTVVNVALPSIRASLDLSSTGLAWVVNGYLLTFGGLILLGGRAGDLLGHRRLFLAGLALFAAASLACGLAQTPGQLIGARFLQGVGGAMTSPAGLALLTLLFPGPRERAKALALWGGIASLGGIVGYILSGLLTDLASWRWVFLINVPVAIAVLALAPKLVPESDVERRRIDFPGAVLGTAALVALVYALLRVPGSQWSSPDVLVPLGLAVVLFTAFLITEVRTAEPLVPLRFFANRARAAANTVMLMYTMALFGMFFVLTLQMQEVLDYSPLQAGLAYLPAAASLLVAMSLSDRVSQLVGRRAVMGGAPLLSAAGMAWLSRMSTDSVYWVDILPAMILISGGAGLAVPALAVAAMAGTTASDAGLGSGVLNAVQQVGGAVGLAVLVSLAATRTTAELATGTGGDAAAVAGYVLALQVGAVVLAVAGVLALIVLGRADELPGGAAPEPAPETAGGATPASPESAPAEPSTAGPPAAAPRPPDRS